MCKNYKLLLIMPKPVELNLFICLRYNKFAIS